MIDTTKLNGDDSAKLLLQTTMNAPTKDDNEDDMPASMSFANLRDSIKVSSNSSIETASLSSDSSIDASDGSHSRLEDVRGISVDNDADNVIVDDQLPPPPPPPPMRQSRLSWGTVQIREYNRTVGDHPEVAYGPPLSLAWDYNQHDPTALDVYEENRKPKKRFLRMTSLTRRNLLHNEFQIPEEDLLEAEKQAQKNQKKRQQSNRQGSFSARAEDRLQSAKRKIIRRFSKEVIFGAMAAASGPFMGMNGMSMAGGPMQVE